MSFDAACCYWLSFFSFAEVVVAPPSSFYCFPDVLILSLDPMLAADSVLPLSFVPAATVYCVYSAFDSVSSFLSSSLFSFVASLTAVVSAATAAVTSAASDSVVVIVVVYAATLSNASSELPIASSTIISVDAFYGLP